MKKLIFSSLLLFSFLSVKSNNVINPVLSNSLIVLDCEAYAAFAASEEEEESGICFPSGLYNAWHSYYFGWCVAHEK